MKPTYEELEQRLIKTENLLKLALERIADLEERLNKNSKNSSKPSSTDRKANTDQTARKPRMPRKGINRKPIPPERVDQFVTCDLDHCPDCGSGDLIDGGTLETLQQVELPEVKAHVTEFSLKKYTCSCCGHSSTANLPKGIPNSVFGPRLMALVANLTGVMHLSKRDAMRLLKDLFDIDICEGSVVNIEERVAAAIKEIYERIHDVVTKSSLCKHFDETSWRDKGKSQFVWIASTSQAACFKIDPSRSREAFERFVGTLAPSPVVTDRYAVYNEVSTSHQYCLAHLIRDFRKFAERKSEDGPLGEVIEKELRATCKIYRAYKRGEISLKSRNIRLGRARKRLEYDLVDGLANASDDMAKFCENVLDDFDHLWVFREFTDVDPTNNLAERDLRKLVLWRKKSYGTRSDRGQRYVERITSIAETIKRHGRVVFTFLKEAITAFYHGFEAPFINSAFSF